jgi:predicted RNase H-like nuclease (RuvC/YqgF family)
MSELPKHVISEAKPYRFLLIIVIAVITTFIAQWFYNQKSTQGQLKKQVQLKQSLSVLDTKLQSMFVELASTTKHAQQLEKALLHQKQELEITQATEQALKQQLMEIQSEVLKLNKELRFYQTITQGNSSSKLQVRDFSLRPTSTVQSYDFRLVLTQGRKLKKPLSGEINLTVNYTEASKHAKAVTYKLNLKHVQVVEGQLKLTQDIPPDSVTITLIQGKKVLLTETANWQSSTSTF